MLRDMLLDIKYAKSQKDRERAYKRLERVGMDRATADFMIKRGGLEPNKENNEMKG